jgi:predicted ArsR family transcriptional regulator
MQRAEKVKETAKKIIDQGQKPSASAIAQELEYSVDDVHRCLNFLENNDEIETYTKEVVGIKQRMIGVKR